MIRLVLFDIDGTLILTGGAGMKAFAESFAAEFDLPHATETMEFRRPHRPRPRLPSISRQSN